MVCMSTSSDLPNRSAAASGVAGHATPVDAASPAVGTVATSGPSAAVRGAVRRLRREHERRAGAVGAWEVSEWLARLVAVQTRLRDSAAVAPERAGPGASASAAAEPAGDPLVGLLAQLRAVTTRYVCRMRGDGMRPEQMLVRVKACVREAMAADGWHDPQALRALTAAAVAWSIAAYYDR